LRSGAVGPRWLAILREVTGRESSKVRELVRCLHYRCTLGREPRGHGSSSDGESQSVSSDRTGRAIRFADGLSDGWPESSGGGSGGTFLNLTLPISVLRIFDREEGKWLCYFHVLNELIFSICWRDVCCIRGFTKGLTDTEIQLATSHLRKRQP